MKEEDAADGSAAATAVRPQGAVLEVLADATRLGLTSFGGPIAHLGYFRADSIVRDAETIRRELSPDEPWSGLGQSYGGFCALTYLSFAPDGLRAALFTGGLAPVDRTIDEVSRAPYRRVLEHFTWDRAAAETAELLRAAVSRTPAGS